MKIPSQNIIIVTISNTFVNATKYIANPNIPNPKSANIILEKAKIQNQHEFP